MRVANWNPERFDNELANASINRLREAAELVAKRAESRCPVGTISRPMYKSGPYAGQPWTARDAGQLKRSIRVVEKHGEKGTRLITGSRNVRVYAGNYLAYYAGIVEHSKPFLRPALNGAKTMIRQILGAK